MVEDGGACPISSHLIGLESALLLLVGSEHRTRFIVLEILFSELMSGIPDRFGVI
jgi:hypothetical protein